MGSGYREIEHTADWELEVWAPDLPALLEQAARGMYALSGARLEETGRADVELSFSAADAESLLVRFLSDLLYFGERDGLGFVGFDLRVSAAPPEGLTLRARLSAASLLSQDKEIKAVTWHKLAVRQTENGLRANIVFDV